MSNQVLGWIAIGLAAAYMAWALPFRRGTVGLAVNGAVALAGAVGLPLVALALGALRTYGQGLGFLLATVGTLAALLVLHVVWERATRAARRADR